MAAVAIVPAAGRGERFSQSVGADAVKLMALVHAEPMLDRTLRALLDGGVAVAIVVLPPVAPSRYAPSRLLDDPRVRTVINPDPSRGMLSSIQAGVADGEGDPIVILPADMPFVRADTVAGVIEACRRTGRIVSPRHDGRRGHPLALPASLRQEILAADARSSLSALLDGRDRLEIDVDDPGILRDVDVAADL